MARHLAVPLLFALLLGSTAAHATDAQTSARRQEALQQFDARFAAADANHDGKLSRDEAKAGMPRVYKHFDEIDTTKKGYVTKEEIAVFLAKQHQQRHPTPQ